MNESKMNELNQTELVLLDLVANALFHKQTTVPAHTDWEALYHEAVKQTVTAQAYRGIRENGCILSEDLEGKWKNAVIASYYHNTCVTADHHYVDEMMRKAGVPYVILKGCASASYYPDPMERTMGDVDFLVRESDLEQAGDILKKEGFIPWDMEHICHVVYRKDSIHLEMHFKPAGMPYGHAGELAERYLQDVMEQASEITYENGTLRFPSPFHHGLILLMHTGHHMLGEGIGLRHLCDWAVFASSFTEEEFREIFEDRLKAIGLWKFACILSRTAEKWLGCPQRAWTECAEEYLADRVIEDIFTGGNFGRKKEGRVYETYLISSRGKGGVGHTSMLRQFVRSINEVIVTQWPNAGRNKLRLLAGWGYFGIRYAVRICTGKRQPLHPLKICRAAKGRKDIYKEFQLYEGSDRGILFNKKSGGNV